MKTETHPTPSKSFMKINLLLVAALGLPLTLHAIVDSDSNGLSDVYEFLYFNGPADPNADPDGDGYTNFEEMVWGTSPTDANSRPTGVTPSLSGYDLFLSWPFASGKWYRLRASQDLHTWQTAKEGSFGSDLEVGVATNKVVTHKFWQVEVELESPDTNGNGLDDWEEALYQRILGVPPSTRDSDGDGLDDLQEFLQGRNPAKKDHPAVGLVVFTPLEK
jgi:hypothetical protein